jgi:uracil-DNA glycosylase
VIELPVDALHAQIRACEKCVAAGYIPRAAPRAWGIAPARFMIIGQAPGIRETTPGGEMYLGPAGMKLRAWMRSAGFDDADFGTRVYMTAITKCFPGRNPGSSKDRAPSSAEQALCRPWLDAQIALVSPKVIILFGKLAIERFLGPGHSLEGLIGAVIEQDERIYLPLPHSSGASTWLNNPAHRAMVETALVKLRELRMRLL